MRSWGRGDIKLLELFDYDRSAACAHLFAKLEKLFFREVARASGIDRGGGRGIKSLAQFDPDRSAKERKIGAKNPPDYFFASFSPRGSDRRMVQTGEIAESFQRCGTLKNRREIKGGGGL
jgi:hypothetical protein